MGNAWIRNLTSAEVVDRSLRTRAAISNGSRLHAKGIDERSSNARRFRDLVASFSASLGGETGVKVNSKRPVGCSASQALVSLEVCAE